MADDAEHRGNSIRGEGSGRDTGKGDIIYTKLKNGSLKLYELEKELPPLDAIRAGGNLSKRRPGQHLRISAYSHSILSAL